MKRLLDTVFNGKDDDDFKRRPFEALYGPPEMLNSSLKPRFDPSENDVEDLYGPPSMLGALEDEPDVSDMPSELDEPGEPSEQDG